MGSGAGSNLVSGYLLSNVNANSGVVSSPTTTYGVPGQGGNDSWGFASEVRAFSKFIFNLEQIGTVALSGFAVTIYGTVSPLAYQTFQYAIQGRNPAGQTALPFGGNAQALASSAQGFIPGIPAAAWSVLMGPNEQASGGASANPLTPTNPFFQGTGPISAIRAVVTTNTTATGSFNVAFQGIP
jgi:hypothetical protein